MSALLKGKGVSLVRLERNVNVGVCLRKVSSLGGQRVWGRRVVTDAQTSSYQRRDEILTKFVDRSGQTRLYSSTRRDVFATHLSSLPVLRGIGPGMVAKRYQHSQALEETAEIDHAPIIASYPEWIKPQDTLPRRHIGPSDEEIAVMLEQLNQSDLDAFIRQTIPDSIRASKKFSIPSEQTPEMEMLDELTKAGKANSAAEVDTYIGMGYHPTITPGVIKRNVLENPGWYTSYTPYQPEISQGMATHYVTDDRPPGEFVEFSNCHHRAYRPSPGKRISSR